MTRRNSPDPEAYDEVALVVLLCHPSEVDDRRDFDKGLEEVVAWCRMQVAAAVAGVGRGAHTI